jgi:hypothetical protein
MPRNTSSDKNRVDDLFIIWFKKVYRLTVRGVIISNLIKYAGICNTPAYLCYTGLMISRILFEYRSTTFYTQVNFGKRDWVIFVFTFYKLTTFNIVGLGALVSHISI